MLYIKVLGCVVLGQEIIFELFEQDFRILFSIRSRQNQFQPYF